jgi:hypothetical protein
MYAHRLAIGLVALLTLTAGCLGGVPDFPGDVPTPPTDRVVGDGTVARAGDDATTPSLSDPERVLREAGSFTATWRYTSTDDAGTRGEMRYDYRVDLAGGRSHVVYTLGQEGEEAPGAWETFTVDNRTYSRFGTGDEAFYQVAEGGVEVVADATGHAAAYETGDLSEMTARGTETFDGVTVHRYELTDVDEWFVGASLAGMSGAAEVTDFRYVVLVDGDGLSRYESWSFAGVTEEGESVSAEWEYSLTGVGTTAVDDPEWLADAEAAGTPGAA